MPQIVYSEDDEDDDTVYADAKYYDANADDDDDDDTVYAGSDFDDDDDADVDYSLQVEKTGEEKTGEEKVKKLDLEKGFTLNELRALKHYNIKRPNDLLSLNKEQLTNNIEILNKYIKKITGKINGKQK